ncbi:histidine kinase [Paenibacillus sp. 481]|nr:histidine kinase [Paenibacillus sp. 481]
MRRGRFRILMAVASGAGKTTELVKEGEACIEQGLKVVWGTTPMRGTTPSWPASPQQHRETGGEYTRDQTAMCDAVPMIEWNVEGRTQRDLDVAALLQFGPDVVLVDGLAHRNRQGASNMSRLDDVRELLRQGISVIATMNAYEDERVHDTAKRMTGIESEWTIPGEVLKEADEVRLLDVSAESLMERQHRQHGLGRKMEIGGNKLKGGYLLKRRTSNLPHGRGQHRLSRSQLGHAAERSRLSILRELALRMLAQDVNGSLEEHRQEMGLIGPSGATERILVLTQYGWNGSIHVRRGHQIAKRLNGELHIVTFVAPEQDLTPVEATFRRSLNKLAHKIGATLEEIACHSRRKMAALLANYALERGVTRIVLGHSRQTRWQEWRNGSLINGLLQHIEDTSLFFIADRAIHEGERILPARPPSSRDVPAPFKRWTEEEMERTAVGLRRGRLKVIIGAAPGVGKTYHMLQEGNRLLAQGIDVVVGLLETHGRRETAAQLGKLPVIPRCFIRYSGRQLEEMDTAGIIARKPEVVLVDELAHTNVPTSERAKRYEDVLVLLDAGISVVTTVNVQHIESLNDAVEQLTGVRVRETVPDNVLSGANEIQLIDVTPQTVRDRLRSGLIYAPDKVEQALQHFFRIPNLIGLRELALREVADDVDERLESWERRALLRGPWRREEVIFVCVEPDERAERLVRHGFRIAHRLKAAMHVISLPISRLSADCDKQLTSVQALTERLGGTFSSQQPMSRRDWAANAVELANNRRATQMIVGLPARNGRRATRSRMAQLMRLARHMDVFIVTDWEGHDD